MKKTYSGWCHKCRLTRRARDVQRRRLACGRLIKEGFCGVCGTRIWLEDL